MTNQFIHKTFKKFDRLSPEAARAFTGEALCNIRLLSSVIDSIAHGILVCGSNDNLVLTNIYAKHLIHIEEDETGKKRVWQLVKNEAIRQFLQKTLQTHVNVDEYEIEIDTNGSIRLLEFAVHPLVEDGRIAGNVVLIADITEKRAKEARLRRLENLASLTTLAAGVAHEIKNPLAAISIHVQLIKKAVDKLRSAGGGTGSTDRAGEGGSIGSDRGGPDKKNAAESFDTHLAVVNDEIKRLNKIVMEFLFAVRPMELHLRRAHINEIVREVIALEIHEAAADGIVLDGELDDSILPLVVDRQLVKQALVNLVKNAIEAIRESSRTGDSAAHTVVAHNSVAHNNAAHTGVENGGGEAVSCGHIRIATQAAGERLLISVADTGPGIPEDGLSRIFEPYWTTKAGGSGLGLTLVFKIVQEHNGEITVRSTEGEGTCFFINLPLPAHDRRRLHEPVPQTGTTMYNSA